MTYNALDFLPPAIDKQRTMTVRNPESGDLVFFDQKNGWVYEEDESFNTIVRCWETIDGRMVKPIKRKREGAHCITILSEHL